VGRQRFLSTNPFYLVMTKLDQILEALDIATIEDKIRTKHHLAMCHYEDQSPTASTFEEFEQEIVKYMRHHLAETGSDDTDLSDERLYEIASQIIEKEHDGIVIVRQNAFLNGMHGILTTLYKGLRQADEEQYIANVFQGYNHDDQVQILGELISRVKGVIPERSMESAEDLVPNFEKVLIEYSEKMHEIRSAFKRYHG